MGQSWNKAHDASKNSYWKNLPSTDTPIVKDELNRNETSVDTIDDRVITLDTTKAEQSDFLGAFLSVTFDSSTGTFTFTKANGTTVVINTDIEKIAVNFDYDDDPTSAHYQNLVLTLSDGTVKYVDLSALITQYEFSDTSTIAFTVSAGGGITANVVNGSITADKLQPNYLADVTTQANNASASATSAGNYKLDAEAWANGTRNGADVPNTDPAYHNNSKWWKDQAQQIASGSIGGLSDVTIDTVTLANGQALVYNTTSQMWENKNLIRPHLIILSETGSVVTATKGTTVISATETSTGHFECDVPEFGSWTIDAVLSGDDAQVSLVVDTVKVYTVDDSHFHADITVTFPSGGTCSCSKSGETTLYANTNPYTFTVHTSGTWTITATGNGETYTENVNVTTSGQTESLSIPVGSTVTPTDSVATLLSCAGINDTSITTLADLFADSTTLLAVISSNNAIDYLVRSTSFASENPLVPKMTSNTAPIGEVIYSSADSGSYAFWAFDGDSSTSFRFGQNQTNNYIGYHFTSPVCPKKVKFYSPGRSESAPTSRDFIVQVSNDNSNWTQIGSGTLSLPTTAGAWAEATLENSNNYSYARILIPDVMYGSGWALHIDSLQFYGSVEQGFCDNSTAMTDIGANNYASNTLLGNSTWVNAICNSTYFESVLNVKVPTMTSSTTPSGEVISGSEFCGYPAWKSFDNGSIANNDRWVSNSTLTDWIGYTFTNDVTPCKMSIANSVDSNSLGNITMNIEGKANDEVNYTTLYTTNISEVPTSITDYIVSTIKKCRSVRCYLTGTTGNYCSVAYLQFYGRVDV